MDLRRQQNVFVYGLLMFPAVAIPIAGLSDPPLSAALSDYARYAINDRDRAKVPGEWDTGQFEENDLEYYVLKVVSRYIDGDRALRDDA